MYYIIFIFLIQINFLFSQIIHSIQVQGNIKTQPHIIIREVKQEINKELNSENIVEDENKIYNLGLFSSVDIEIIKDSSNKNIYMITVSEMWYIWPFPIIKYDNKSDQVSYGGGIAHNNFRGRDEQIALGATFGNVREYFLWYENPWISGDHNSLELGLYNESSDHHVYNIIEKDKGFFSGVGFFKGYNHKFNFSFNYNYKLIESIEESDKDILDAEYLSQLKFSYVRLGSKYRYDTRDIYIDPNSGIFFKAISNNLFGINGVKNIYEVILDFYIYKNLFSGYLNPVFKYNFSSNFQYSSTDLPIFKKEYIGGQGYIRGYSAIPSENPMSNFEEVIEVDNFLINTFEIQSTLINRKEYLEKVEMGLDLVFFADCGVGYNLNKSINLDNAITGYGLGLRIFLMGGVIKLDYGFNPYGTSRLHLF